MGEGFEWVGLAIKDRGGVLIMKIIAGSFMLLLCFAFAAAGMSGCSTQNSQIVKRGNFYIDVIPSNQASFSDITAMQQGSELVISGKLRRRNTAFSGAGRVDIAVVSPGGAVIDTAKVPYTPKILPKTPGARNHRPSQFEARLRCVTPKWAVIRIAFHGTAFSDDSTMEDAENDALPKDYDYGG
jgi:hypothetical protein